MYPAPLVLDPAVGLEGDAGAGGLRDDGHKLGVGMGWDRVLGAAFSLFSSGSPGSLPSRVQAHTPSPHLVAIPLQSTPGHLGPSLPRTRPHLLAAHKALFLPEVHMVDGQALFCSGLKDH